MPLSFVDSVIGVFKDPITTFQKERESTIRDASLYFVILFVIYSILGGIISFFFMNNAVTPVIPALSGLFPGFNAISLLILMTVVLMFIFIIVWALILHLVVLLLGGKNGIQETLKAVFYSSTPFFVFGWIPMVSFVFMLWSLALSIIGVRELQNISVGKSILAVIVALSITYLFFGVIIAGIVISAFKPGMV